MKYLIGIDEAGRAPLAGPLAVGAAMVKAGFDWSQVGGIRDSKKMTALSRSRFFAQMQRMRHEGTLRFSVAYAPPAMIDEWGLTRAVEHAIERALHALKADPRISNVFLDGALYAPEEFEYQQTIIGGDDVLPIISIAAIAAKVSRDRLMVRLSRQYPEYGFEIHKGYPTRAHREAIHKVGLCEQHRLRFCDRLLETVPQLSMIRPLQTAEISV